MTKMLTTKEVAEKLHMGINQTIRTGLFKPGSYRKR